jgi:hypothetical protein
MDDHYPIKHNSRLRLQGPMQMSDEEAAYLFNRLNCRHFCARRIPSPDPPHLQQPLYFIVLQGK